MSGGTFDHTEYSIHRIAEDIEEIIKQNENQELDCYGDRIGRGFDKSIISKFKETAEVLNRAYAMVRRVDYLLAGDDGEESFHRRWKTEVPAAPVKGIHPNDRVMLKPTKEGIEQIAAAVSDLNAEIKAKGGRGEVGHPCATEEGYITGQFWSLMRYFDWYAGDVPFTDLKPAPIEEYCHKHCPACGDRHRNDYKFDCCSLKCQAEYATQKVDELEARVKELGG